MNTVVEIDYGLLASLNLLEFLQKQNRRIVIITDSNVKNMHAIKLQNYCASNGLVTEIIFFPAGEQYKTRETKLELEDQLLLKKYGRDLLLVAIGGGVVTDLVGYLAATYCRGVPVIYIPTTLMAMVDASIGGKTGVNTNFGKNLIGTITQPQAIFMDLDVLQTLSVDILRDGFAEIVKHGLVLDAKLLNKNKVISQQLIMANYQLKMSVVLCDEKESGYRQILNFGHTIAHGIECLENYNISHGSAVAIGLLVECYLSVITGHLNVTILEDVRNLLIYFGFSLQTSAFNDLNLFLQILQLDKKAINLVPRFVLLMDLGKPYIINNQYTHEVSIDDLNQALQWAKNNFSLLC